MISGPSLHVFVEGPDDERFFDAVVRPRLGARYSAISCIKYARTKKDSVTAMLRALRGSGKQVMFLVDIDLFPCPDERRRDVVSKYGVVVEQEVHVVIKEIESWYAAGLDRDGCSGLGLRWRAFRFGTHELSKEAVYASQIRPDSMTHQQLLIGMLAAFDYGRAKHANPSFKRFVLQLGI